MLKPYDILEKVLLEIDNGIRKGVNINVITDKLSISRSNLGRIFTMIFNQPIADYIRSRKLVASIDDLLNKKLKIIDIAIMYDFGYEQTYIRAFKNEFGITPGQFRKTKLIKRFHGQIVDNKNINDIYIKPEIIMKPKFWKREDNNYAIWRNKGQTAMAVTRDGCFNCKWDKCKKVVIRVGKIFDEIKTHSQLGEMKLDFEANYIPKEASMLCIYGWSVNPLIEFFIVENGNINRNVSNLKEEDKKGTFFIDGSEYIIYEKKRINRLTIKGIQTFKQYWSIRTNMRNNGSASISEHFNVWEKSGMYLGKIFEIALKIEGRENSGIVEVYRNKLTIGTSLETSKKIS